MYENRGSGYHLLKNKNAICKRRTLVYQVLAAKERGFCRTGKIFLTCRCGTPAALSPNSRFHWRKLSATCTNKAMSFFSSGVSSPILLGLGKGFLGQRSLSVRNRGLLGIFLFKEELNGRPADAGDFPQGDRVGGSLAGFVVGVSGAVYVEGVRNVSAESTLPAGGPAVGAPLRKLFVPPKPFAMETYSHFSFRRRLPAAFSSSMPCFAGNNRLHKGRFQSAICII